MSIGLSASLLLSDQKTLTGYRLNGLLHCKFLWEKRLHVFVKALPGVNCSIQNYLAGIKYNVFVGNRGCWYIGKKARRHCWTCWHSLRHTKNIWYATKARSSFQKSTIHWRVPIIKTEHPSSTSETLFTRQYEKRKIKLSTKVSKCHVVIAWLAPTLRKCSSAWGGRN